MNLLPTILTLAIAIGPPSEPRLFDRGGDDSTGILVDYTAWVAPGYQFHAGRPTIVVIHGINPAPRRIRSAMAVRYAEAIGRAGGRAVNVLGWEWNASTLKRLRPSRNVQDAEWQGCRLARDLLSIGVEPGSLMLIGQSTGSVVAASAARELARFRGVPVGRMILLDPVATQHSAIFGRLAAADHARVVEHYWARGPSGFGRPARDPRVIQAGLPPRSGGWGLVRPSRADHLNVVRWHIGRVAEGR